MKDSINLHAFLRGALAGILAAGLLAASVHWLARPARSRSKPPPRTVATSPRAPVPAVKRTPVIQTRFKSTAPNAPKLEGTNWIQSPLAGCKLPFYQLKMNPMDLNQLEFFSRSDDRRPAAFFADSMLYEHVGVRNRGDWARSWTKKSLKIFFDKDKPFGKEHVLNLNSGWHDPAFIREPLAYHVYEVCGALSLKSRMVRVHINGEFRGLFVEVEQPDKPFLSRYKLQGGSIYKAISSNRQSDERNLGRPEAYASHYEKENKKTEGYDELHQFCLDLEKTSDAVDFFTRRMDVEKYINYLAATVLVQNWDCPNKNHFLVYDGRGSQKWLVVPWDLDRTFGDHWRHYFTETQLPILLGTRQSPSTTGWNRLADQFLSEPSLRARFLTRLAELLEKEFTPEKLFPVVDRWENEISEDAALDRQRWGGGNNEEVHAGILQVKLYIKQRRAYLLREIPKLQEASQPVLETN